jgi:hypothetical protein
LRRGQWRLRAGNIIFRRNDGLATVSFEDFVNGGKKRLRNCQPKAPTLLARAEEVIE